MSESQKSGRQLTSVDEQLASIPPEMRTAICDAYVPGTSFKKLARQFGLSPQVVEAFIRTEITKSFGDIPVLSEESRKIVSLHFAKQFYERYGATLDDQGVQFILGSIKNANAQIVPGAFGDTTFYAIDFPTESLGAPSIVTIFVLKDNQQDKLITAYAPEFFAKSNDNRWRLKREKPALPSRAPPVSSRKQRKPS